MGFANGFDSQVFSPLFYGLAGAVSPPLNTLRIVPVGVMITGSLKMDCGLIFCMTSRTGDPPLETMLALTKIRRFLF